MACDDRRLKRGLKDVSNLFVDDSAVEAKLLESDESFLKCVAICRPLAHSTHIISSKVAQSLRQCGISSAVLSIGRKADSAAARSFEGVLHEISWAEFELLKRKTLSGRVAPSIRRQALFLDFDDQQPDHLKSIIPLLDRWIFSVPATVDGIIEAYRMMKGTRRLVQNSMQYCLVFEGTANEREVDEVLFEKFSAILSERLGINLVWLGHVSEIMRLGCREGELDLSHFFLRDAESFDFSDKLALFDHIRQPAASSHENI